MTDPVGGSVAVKEDDTFSIVSGLTGIVVQSVDGDGLRTVTEMELCDKESRPGKYTGTVSGSGIVAPSIPHGEGKMVYDSGIVYEGGWKHGTWEDYALPKTTCTPVNLQEGSFGVADCVNGRMVHTTKVNGSLGNDQGTVRFKVVLETRQKEHGRRTRWKGRVE